MAKAEYRSAIRSRKLINKALADLLQEKPLEKITVTDIVNRAEINRGTFYAHYRDVPDVVNSLVRKTFSSIQEALNRNDQSLTEAAHALLRQVQRILEEDLEFVRKIMNSGDAAILQEQLVAVIVEYMLQHRDDFYSGSPENYEIAIRFGAGGLSNLYRDWFAGKLPCTLEELTRIGETMILRIIGEDSQGSMAGQ